MRLKNVFLTSGILLLFTTSLNAQKSEYKFGQVGKQDFAATADAFDSGANAIIIADIGSTRFEGNAKGDFTLIYTRFMRVKIVNKNGFDIGKYTIGLYHDGQGNYEKLGSIKASTFNLENGAVVETKLDQKSIFSEKYNKQFDETKFSLPALKEGCVFDLSYTIRSDFDTQLRSWDFQGSYPRLYSEYMVMIPSFYSYMVRMRGDTHFAVDTSYDLKDNFTVHSRTDITGSDDLHITAPVLYKKWVKKNVPSLHEQPYTTSLDNYNSGVIFQLHYFQWNEESPRHDYLASWPMTAHRLMDEESFGLALSYENNWMNNELNSIYNGTDGDEVKARKIYAYIRNNFKEDGYSGIYAHNSLKDVYKGRGGSASEINLLLTAMLQKAGIAADPAILSTRENGIADPSYPLISEYNYTICTLVLNNKFYELDASKPFLGFGELPVSCYNGYAHIMNEKKPLPIFLSADSLWEKTFTMILIQNDDKGKALGNCKETLGRAGSYDTREEIKKSTLKTYTQKLQTEQEVLMSIDNLKADSLDNRDMPLTVSYDFDPKIFNGSDMIYFNPMWGEGYKTNPFNAMARLYPVEMPFKIDETYILNMEVPAGYQIEEIPKSTRSLYNEDEGMFEYLIQKGDGKIQMRVHLILKKAFFPTDEYNTLRDFFAAVVKKENEQIVFRKIK